MKRRHFVMGITAGALGLAGYRYWPEQGLWNPCLDGDLPADLAGRELVQAAWEGLDPVKVWDCHVHLIGVGAGGSGIWVNPDMDSLLHPVQYAQKRFYFNASCADTQGDADAGFVERLHRMLQDFPDGARLMLLGFDYHYDEAGKRIRTHSSYHTPNEYARRVAREAPGRFEWIASIHPYRKDAVEALVEAAAHGARAVKWLPPAQGMDPASPACDRFYQGAARLDLPLLVHAGAELAVQGGNTEDFGNPLRLRRALDQGVKVIVAHCASLGSGVDLDRGPHAGKVHNFELFARLMDEKRYEGLLYGDISAVTQINRRRRVVDTLLQREDWHGRLLNGSDYPLPGVMPIFSLRQMTRRGYIDEKQAGVLSRIRPYNALLFDFLVKRSLRFEGRGFHDEVFETRRIFEREPGIAV